MAWWNDYDRGDYGRWSTRYDTSYWNNPEGRAFGYGAGAYGGGYGHGEYGRYGGDYTPRVAPSESPAYGRQADRLLRRNAYDAGYTVQPRGGRGMEGGYRGGREGSWRQNAWNDREGFGGFGGSGYRGGAGGYNRGYGSDYGGYGSGSYGAGAYGSRGYGTGGYGGSWGGYDRGYRW